MKTLFNVLIVCLLLSADVYAQDNSQKALARAQYMLKQMSAEKNKLQVENRDLQKSFDVFKEEMNINLANAEKREKKLKRTLDKWKNEYEILKGRYIDASKNLMKTSREKDFSNEKLSRQTDNYNICFEHNNKLVEINEELLKQFNSKNAWDALTQNEPIIGMGKVNMENLLQTYKFKIEDMNLGFNHHLIKKIVQ